MNSQGKPIVQSIASSNDLTNVAVVWNRDNQETHSNFLNKYYKDETNKFRGQAIEIEKR